MGPEIHTGCFDLTALFHPSDVRRRSCLIGDVDDDGEFDSRRPGVVRSSFGGGDSALATPCGLWNVVTRSTDGFE
jgi:hypothetical protein